MHKTSLKIFPNRLETKRLSLRAYEFSDRSLLYEAGMRNKDHFTEFESGNLLLQLKNAEHTTTIIEELNAAWEAGRSFFIGIFEKGTDAWAGQVFVALTNQDLPEYHIGYVADVHYEGKGYISEAVTGVLEILFQEMGAQRVKSDCHENNVRSWRLLERCGFRREGHLRENCINPDGSFHGDFLYGLLHREFEIE